jgi:hypothetical protein
MYNTTLVCTVGYLETVQYIFYKRLVSTFKLLPKLRRVLNLGSYDMCNVACIWDFKVRVRFTQTFFRPTGFCEQKNDTYSKTHLLLQYNIVRNEI